MSENELEAVDEIEVDEGLEVEAEGPDDTGREEPEGNPEAEAEARKYGWRPKDEFDRDPKGWVDASRFLELPTTQKKMVQDELRQTTSEFTRRMERLERSNKAAMKRALEVQQEAHERDLKNVEAAQRRAVEDGDTDRYDALARHKQVLMKAAPRPDDADDTPAGPDPYVSEYKESAEGAWLKDPMLFDFASRAIDNSRGAAGQTAREQIAYAKTQVEKYFPHMFETKPKPRASRVDGGGLAGGRASGGAAKLPPEAVRAGKDFVKQGLFKSLDDYAKTYFEQEG